MSTSRLLAFVPVLVVLLPFFARGASPYLDEVCKDVECGKGHCKAAPEHPLGFTCECEIGWKRTRFGNEDRLQFLPCVIPNCTLNYTCMPAAPPAPSIPFNSSLLDVCYWAYCGEGSCKKQSFRKYSCDCKTGHQNLLNSTVYPCYSECALGSDCASLGIRVGRRSSSFTPMPRFRNTSNQGSSFLPGELYWVPLLFTSLFLTP